MASVEEVISQLKRLPPEQVDEVARIIHDLSQSGCGEAPPHAAVPTLVVGEAVLQGWPAELFAELIGSLPELERCAQLPAEDRTSS
jgi:hypothetical protein